MYSPARLFNRFRATGTNGRLKLNLNWRASEFPLKNMQSMVRVQGFVVSQR